MKNKRKTWTKPRGRTDGRSLQPRLLPSESLSTQPRIYRRAANTGRIYNSGHEIPWNCVCVWDRRRKRKKKYKQETHPACLGRRIVGDAGISLTRVSNQSRSDFLFNFISYFLFLFVFFKLYFCTTMHTHTLTCALFFMMGRTEEEREDAALQQSDIVPVCFLYSGGFTDKQLLLLFGGLTCRREKHLAFGCWNKKINVSMLYPMNSEAFEFLCVWRQQTNVSGDWKVKKGGETGCRSADSSSK